MTLEDERDDYKGALAAAGALLTILWASQRTFEGLTDVRPVADLQGNFTNQIDIGISFLGAPYRLTIERVRDESACSCWHHTGRLSCPVHPTKPT